MSEFTYDEFITSHSLAITFPTKMKKGLDDAPFNGNLIFYRVFTLFQKNRHKIKRIFDTAFEIFMLNKQWHQIKFCEQNE